MKKLFAVLGVIASLAYLISPIDLIPDAILGLGFIDDLFVIPILLKCLKILGLDASRLFGRRSEQVSKESDIIDVKE